MSVTTARDDAREQESRKRAWRSLYRTYATRFLQDLPAGAKFTGEDLRGYVERRIGKPHHPNCWGWSFRDMADQWDRTRAIQPAGMQPMTGRKAHGRLTPVYRKREGLMAKIVRKVFR